MWSCWAGKFATEVTAERHCGLVMASTLDFEERKDYTLTLVLEAPEAPPDTENRMAQVRDPPDVGDSAVTARYTDNNCIIHTLKYSIRVFIVFLIPQNTYSVSYFQLASSSSYIDSLH